MSIGKSGAVDHSPRRVVAHSLPASAGLRCAQRRAQIGAVASRKFAAYLAAVFVIGLTVGALLEARAIRRIAFLESLFSGTDQVEHFRNMRSLFPMHEVARAPVPLPFGTGLPIALPTTFAYGGKSDDTQAFLDATDTTGLLIVKDDKIVFERYWRGNDAGSHWLSWSVAKSFVSVLIGVAVQEGAIASIDDPVTKYAPELRGTAYQGVRIKDALQMSSGVQWNEDYSDRGSDIFGLGPTLAFGRSLDAFAATLKREYVPGTFRDYDSMDAQVLGLVLRRATRSSLAQYLAAKLWTPLGMESDAFWITDDLGVEWAGAGMNATLRDYAKLGRLFLNNGRCNGVQLVAADWVRRSVAADAPHLVPGERHTADSTWGYGYQWWIPDNSGDYAAVGIYNQFVYVSPARRLIIAKTSANHAYGVSDDEATYREGEHIAFFKAIEAAVGQ